ncbi:helix-turn-helix transcriptional regulator [Streptomyces sp. TLI_185]|uniref:helix-turn-helix domain-containing protein n=1 Tax=Streptomyces sp. TLI_185 TaxID=2485151 RepID=UPI000F4D349C|nr:helix-turn-helix transcriptional regulator [Streptomyces sp. TLI_185]RPF34983.1 hypothetical protein EDD92_4971 [Streptomyces sp. TLI_185]
MSTHRLDVPQLHRRLDARRRELGLTWRGVARQTQLAPATFSRIINGRSLEADALVTLLVWLDLDTGIAALIEPGNKPLRCPDCGRVLQPKRDGSMRAHPCKEAAG